MQPCSTTNTAITLTPEQIRVTPLHGVPCRFSGRYPVWLITARQKGTPPHAAGELSGGHTYVQTYDEIDPVDCPAPGPESPSTVTVELEGQHVEVTVGIEFAHDIGCVTLVARDSHFE